MEGKPTIAEEILKKAINQIGSKSEEHGKTEPSFQMVAELWDIYIRHSINIKDTIHPEDVCQLMVLLKCARQLYGHSEDHYVDEAGYAALSAMLKHRGEDK